MLRQVAEGVMVHESEFCQSNAVAVEGNDGVLLIDPGVHGHELDCLAGDLAILGRTVVAGFSTHPHWDHLLWNPAFGAVSRFGTARCAATVRERLANGIDTQRFGIPGDVPLDLLGLIAGLPEGTTHLPWNGPAVRVLEHDAHAPGHAAVLVEEAGVLIAGDMLSDVLMPMLDLSGAADPVGDYLAALQMLENAADGVHILVPGHGSVCRAEELRARMEQDRAYLQALGEGQASNDRRIGAQASSGWEWVAGVHQRQVQALAERRGEGGGPV